MEIYVDKRYENGSLIGATLSIKYKEVVIVSVAIPVYAASDMDDECKDIGDLKAKVSRLEKRIEASDLRNLLPPSPEAAGQQLGVLPGRGVGFGSARRPTKKQENLMANALTAIRETADSLRSKLEVAEAKIAELEDEKKRMMKANEELTAIACPEVARDGNGAPMCPELDRMKAAAAKEGE